MNSIDKMLEVCKECLVMTTCDNICDKVKDDIMYEKSYMSLDWALEFIITKQYCPFCGRDEVLYYNDKSSTFQNVMCCFCHLIYNIKLYPLTITLNNIGVFNDKMQSRDTFNGYVNYIKSLKLTEGFAEYDMR